MSHLTIYAQGRGTDKCPDDRVTGLTGRPWTRTTTGLPILAPRARVSVKSKPSVPGTDSGLGSHFTSRASPLRYRVHVALGRQVLNARGPWNLEETRSPGQAVCLTPGRFTLEARARADAIDQALERDLAGSAAAIAVTYRRCGL